MNRFRLALLSLLALAGVIGSYQKWAPDRDTVMQRARGQHTVADRIAQFGPQTRARWQPHFERAGLRYPPRKIVMLGLKAEKRLEVYAQENGQWKWIRAFPILKASGQAGPKLREGDYQVPEGLYDLEGFNPNSAFHVALRVGYPSAQDRAIGAREGRSENELGGDIMIHGGAASVGCLAMGDQAAEDLFVLAAEVGRENVRIALAPRDFRVEKLSADAARPAWLHERYRQLDALMGTLPPGE